MRRLIVMSIVVGLTACFAVPATAQTASGGSSVTIGNFMTDDADAPSGVKVCVDGESVAAFLPAGTSLAPIELSAGPHTFEFGALSVCGFNQVTTLTIPADGDVTVFGYGTPFGLVSLLDNPTCADAAGVGYTFRHGATAGPVDVYVTPPAGTEIKILTSVASGSQATAQLPIGSYADVQARLSSDGSVLVEDLGPLDVTTRSIVLDTIYGSVEGSIGSTRTVTPADLCGVAPTTVPTSTPAATAQPVTVAAAFTG